VTPDRVLVAAEICLPPYWLMKSEPWDGFTGDLMSSSAGVEFSRAMNQTLLEYFRCPDRYVRLRRRKGFRTLRFFFSFGKGVVGMENMRSSAVRFSKGALRDAWQDADCASGSVCLPFVWRSCRESPHGALCRGSPVRQFRRRVIAECITRSGLFCRLLSAAFATPVLERLEQDRFSELAGGSYVDSLVRGSDAALLRTQRLQQMAFIGSGPRAPPAPSA